MISHDQSPNGCRLKNRQPPRFSKISAQVVPHMSSDPMSAIRSYSNIAVKNEIKINVFKRNNIKYIWFAWAIYSTPCSFIKILATAAVAAQAFFAFLGRFPLWVRTVEGSATVASEALALKRLEGGLSLGTPRPFGFLLFLAAAFALALPFAFGRGWFFALLLLLSLSICLILVWFQSMMLYHKNIRTTVLIPYTVSQWDISAKSLVLGLQSQEVWAPSNHKWIWILCASQNVLMVYQRDYSIWNEFTQRFVYIYRYICATRHADLTLFFSEVTLSRSLGTKYRMRWKTVVTSP